MLVLRHFTQAPNADLMAAIRRRLTGTFPI